jgi:hypothetical protein
MADVKSPNRMDSKKRRKRYSMAAGCSCPRDEARWGRPECGERLMRLKGGPAGGGGGRGGRKEVEESKRRVEGGGGVYKTVGGRRGVLKRAFVRESVN